jgi:transcriptional regulator with XRE-family HTH domain
MVSRPIARIEPGESLGELLARVRQASGRTQLRVAEALCASAGWPTVTRHEVARWERGTRIPAGYWLAHLAVVLGVDVLELEQAAARSRQTRGSHAAPAAVNHAPQGGA